MQFLHIVASHANILRPSSRVGEERCSKALRTLHGGEAKHCPYYSPSRLDSAAVQERIKDRTREMAEIEPILPTFLRVLNGKNCLTMKRFLKGCLWSVFSLWLFCLTHH